MSTSAQAILEQFKALPAEEQGEVCAGLLQIEARRKLWEAQKVRLRDMQSRHHGRGLLEVLLEERARERARG